uniref:Ig-like domain-containing protein n=1 Tax=Xenopus tropicalis TaxID=8364 RepID=F7AY53_XENTR
GDPHAPSVFPLRPCCGSLGSDSHVTVGCLSSGFLPAPVTVKWNSGAITSGIKNFPAVLQQSGSFASSSQLTIPLSDWKDKSFECNVEHAPTSTKVNKKIPGHTWPETCSLTPKVEVLPPTPKDLLVNREPKVYCVISKMASAEGLTVKWSRSDKKRVIAFDSPPEKEYDGTFTVKSILKISSGDWQPRNQFSCNIIHPDLPSPIEKSIQKDQGKNQGAEPIISLLPPSDDELRNDFVSLVCVVKDFKPKEIYIFWKKDGVPIEKEYYITTTPVLEEEEDTYLAFSKLTIAKSDWIRGATFSCIAAHNTISQRDIKKNRGK